MKNYLLLIAISFFFFSVKAQNLLISSLKKRKYREKSYEVLITEKAQEGDRFTGERLIMQVLSYEDNQIKIPIIIETEVLNSNLFQSIIDN